MSDYAKILLTEYQDELDSGNGGQGRPETTRLDWLGNFVFDFTTYDDDISELFGAKAVDFCKAVQDRTTFTYIEDPENYRWFLLMANMSFFADRLNWGTSVRGAFWDFEQRPVFLASHQLTFKDDVEWKLFVAAIIEFASTTSGTTTQGEA